jgi:hypothetical protein
MTRRPVISLALAVALSGLIVACEGSGVVHPTHTSAGFGGNSTTLSQSLVGTWRHTFEFFDDFGFANSTETTWRFAADGTAERSIVARNLTAGLADTLLTTARWTASDDTLTIEFTAPSPGTVDFSVSVQGNQLTLAGEAYTRVSE